MIRGTTVKAQIARVSTVAVLALGVLGVPAAMACGGGHGGSHDGRTTSSSEGSHRHDRGWHHVTDTSGQPTTSGQHDGHCGGSTGGNPGTSGDGGGTTLTPPLTL